MQTVIVTGGLGYIGSHTVYELLSAGYNVLIIDNCSSIGIKRGEKTYNILLDVAIQYDVSCIWHNADITQYDSLISLQLKADWIIHFAAYKNVGESRQKPLEYYSNNLIGLLNILRFAKHIGCPNFIFSSSSTVYSHECIPPFTEQSSDGKPTQHPYGNTKIFAEQILSDTVKGDTSFAWNIVMLRYFNPVGAHPSGLLGEPYNSKCVNNLFPAILGAQLTGNPISVFGNDYNTIDGTCVRDYIHVVDVAKAHMISAIKLFGQKGLHIYNIGLGKGKSVMEIISEFMRQGFEFKWQMGERREGDAETSYCDNSLALKELEWIPMYELEDMVAHTIKFFKNFKT